MCDGDVGNHADQERGVSVEIGWKRKEVVEILNS